ncbi:MAG TPA: GrpB family protein [Rubellimicrobium sp.]|nr:GrpB family protein [Rubellimicrobium sp.]
MEIADPFWPALYEREAQRLVRVLGPCLQAIEHIGSTAVPGLAAKPVLDIMAAVVTLEEADARLPLLAALGYGLHATGLRERLVLQRAAQPGRPAVNLHIVTLASWPTRRERRFRNRLRAHPEEATLYAALKRDLAGRFGSDMEGYTRAKTALIQEIMDRVADEAGEAREDVREP